MSVRRPPSYWTPEADLIPYTSVTGERRLPWEEPSLWERLKAFLRIGSSADDESEDTG